MKPPFVLVPDEISHDSVQCLRALLKHAEEGRLIGIAFAAMYKQRRYAVNTAGECFRNRTFTRGMVADLQESLGTNVNPKFLP